MLTLIVPAYSAGPDIERTIDSVKGICDEVVIISTALYPEDLAAFKQLTPKVVELPWNYVFTCAGGFGELYNQGTPLAKNDWLLLFGVAETFAESYTDVLRVLKASSPQKVYKCDHVNDPNRWGRIWNKASNSRWSGLIHETIVGGIDGDVIFRMQDTEKLPQSNPYRATAFKLIKSISYNHAYTRLNANPSLLGGTHPNWLRFINGAWEGITSHLDQHKDLLKAALDGDRQGFLDLIKIFTDGGSDVTAVNFKPTGQWEPT